MGHPGLPWHPSPWNDRSDFGDAFTGSPQEKPRHARRNSRVTTTNADPRDYAKFSLLFLLLVFLCFFFSAAHESSGSRDQSVGNPRENGGIGRASGVFGSERLRRRWELKYVETEIKARRAVNPSGWRRISRWIEISGSSRGETMGAFSSPPALFSLFFKR